MLDNIFGYKHKRLNVLIIKLIQTYATQTSKRQPKQISHMLYVMVSGSITVLCYVCGRWSYIALTYPITDNNLLDLERFHSSNLFRLMYVYKQTNRNEIIKNSTYTTMILYLKFYLTTLICTVHVHPTICSLRLSY